MKKGLLIVGISLVVVAAATIGYKVLPNCNLETVVTVKGETVKLMASISAKPCNDEKINLLSGDIYDFIKENDYTVDKCLEYYEKGGSKPADKYAPESVKILWESKEEADQYTLKVATNKQMKDAKRYVTLDRFIELKNLLSDTNYYYQIIAKFEDKTVKSKIFSFVTADLPRTLDIAGVPNTRDIGGYVTEDGKSEVKQGMVYRGGNLNSMTSEGKMEAVHELGIKTDLDLRGSSENSGIITSPFGEDINYVLVNAPWYAGDSNGIDSATRKDALKQELKVFANKDNYPIYVHCTVGRDRTGTCLFLIESLIGMSYEDIKLDYQLSFFSEIGSGNNIADLCHNFGKLYSHLKTKYPEKETLSERAECFMLDLGLTKSEINSIRTSLLESVK